MYIPDFFKKFYYFIDNFDNYKDAPIELSTLDVTKIGKIDLLIEYKSIGYKIIYNTAKIKKSEREESKIEKGEVEKSDIDRDRPE